MSEVIKVISEADASNRYLTSEAMDQLKKFVNRGEQRVRAAKSLTDNREKIIATATLTFFSRRLSTLFIDRSSYTETMVATTMRDLDYYLRLVTYAVIAGDTSVIDDIGLLGACEMFTSLGIPLRSVAAGIFSVAIASTYITSQEENEEVQPYFEYIISAFDGLSHHLRRLIKKICAEEIKGSSYYSNLQEKIENEEFVTNDFYFEIWEPKSQHEWLIMDKLSQQIQYTGVEDKPAFEAAASVLFESWRDMPIPIKKKVWREREIIAALYSHMEEWQEIPGFSHIGVAKNPSSVNNNPVGCIVFNFDCSDSYYDRFSIPRSIEVESSIRDFSQEKEIFIWLESSLPFANYAQSITSRENPASETISKHTDGKLQSGDLIVGSNRKIDRVDQKRAVTLSTFVTSQNSTEVIRPQAMSVRHGFTGGYTDIRYYSSRADEKIGTVSYQSITQEEQAEKLDISIINLEEAIEPNCSLKWIDTVPGKLIPCWTGALVQMYGGVSGHVTGYIHNSMVIFPGASSPIIPDFTAIISSCPGDSGSLLVGGNDDSGNPIPTPEDKAIATSTIEEFKFASLGILIAGAPKGGNYEGLAYFRPMLNICQQLHIKLYSERDQLPKDANEQSEQNLAAPSI